MRHVSSPRYVFFFSFFFTLLTFIQTVSFRSDPQCQRTANAGPTRANKGQKEITTAQDTTVSSPSVFLFYFFMIRYISLCISRSKIYLSSLQKWLRQKPSLSLSRAQAGLGLQVRLGLCFREARAWKSRA